ncbi:hypothetical protein [Nocardioides sp. CFH 31398]|uniref:hypothetical protein n=1 Tax=Nocardioides sp. CFH 31398 TaxID=2919579 RepID=UPI001F05CD37|nr:hypothetical protein [Nocardioides sp. CFH 31398]MCH1865041.1 hypothetical protein [Nocardioides sp. CFH 31398]
MTQPALWWQHHRMQPPVMTSGSRWAVAHYPWGVAVWEKPLHWTAPAGPRVVDVVVTDPGAPVGLAREHAVERMPSPSLARRTASALPFPASPRSVTAAAVAAVLTAVAAAAADGSGWFLLVIPVLVLVLLLADRVPPHEHPAAWRRRGHQATALPFTGRVQLADAVCARSAHQPYAAAVVHAVRTALWECRDDHRAPRTVGRPRLDAWLDDLDDGDRLAAEVLSHTTGARAGAATVVDRAAALVPDLVAGLANPSAGQRGQVLRQLAQLRDACAEALAARDSLADAVGSVEAVGHDVHGLALPGRSAADEWVATRVEDLLGDLHAEATVLREVEAELRTRDGLDVRDA